MGGSRTNPYALRLQASREKPNYKKGLNWKSSCGLHTDDKDTKKINFPANDTSGKYLRTCK
jgi:hypothetical protein